MDNLLSTKQDTLTNPVTATSALNTNLETYVTSITDTKQDTLANAANLVYSSAANYDLETYVAEAIATIPNPATKVDVTKFGILNT